MNEEAVSLWIRRAESDLKIGKGELATEDPATDAICFHMQQCAEKYLKAFLIFHGQEVPRTHDIAFLILRCGQIDPEFQQLVGWSVPSLTTYAVEVRYDTLIFPSVEETKHAALLWRSRYATLFARNSARKATKAVPERIEHQYLRVGYSCPNTRATFASVSSERLSSGISHSVATCWAIRGR